jgi:hypothetical protein
MSTLLMFNSSSTESLIDVAAEPNRFPNSVPTFARLTPGYGGRQSFL